MYLEPPFILDEEFFQEIANEHIGRNLSDEEIGEIQDKIIDQGLLLEFICRIEEIIQEYENS